TGASLAIVAPLPGSSTLTRVLSTAHGAGTSISGSVLGLPVTLMASRSFDTLIEGLVGAADGSSDPDGSGDPDGAGDSESGAADTRGVPVGFGGCSWAQAPSRGSVRAPRPAVSRCRRPGRGVESNGTVAGYPTVPATGGAPDPDRVASGAPARDGRTGCQRSDQRRG